MKKTSQEAQEEEGSTYLCHQTRTSQQQSGQVCKEQSQPQRHEVTEAKTLDEATGRQLWLSYASLAGWGWEAEQGTQDTGWLKSDPGHPGHSQPCPQAAGHVPGTLASSLRSLRE